MYFVYLRFCHHPKSVVNRYTTECTLDVSELIIVRQLRLKCVHVAVLYNVCRREYDDNIVEFLDALIHVTPQLPEVHAVNWVNISSDTLSNINDRQRIYQTKTKSKPNYLST